MTKSTKFCESCAQEVSDLPSIKDGVTEEIFAMQLAVNNATPCLCSEECESAWASIQVLSGNEVPVGLDVIQSLTAVRVAGARNLTWVRRAWMT